MDPDTIKQLAAEIAQHLPSYPWALLAVQILLTVVAAGIGAFLGEYLKARGKNLATKADFDSLHDQLRANTELVETIKVEVNQRDWAKREWQHLRQMKLEQFLDKKHECLAFLYKMRAVVSGGAMFTERDPHVELETLATLYFSELQDITEAFLTQFRKEFDIHTHWVGICKDFIPSNISQQEEAAKEYLAELSAHFPKLIKASRDVDAAASKLLLVIMGVA